MKTRLEPNGQSEIKALQLTRVERAIRKIRQRIFDMPEAKQDRAGLAIERLKARAFELRPSRPAGGTNYHWMYAAEGEC